MGARRDREPSSAQLDLAPLRERERAPLGIAAEPKRIACPACGFYFDFLNGSAPTYGRLACEECGYVFAIDPMPMPTDVIHFSGASEIEAGATAIRALRRAHPAR